jgi:hypothetical protein
MRPEKKLKKFDLCRADWKQIEESNSEKQLVILADHKLWITSKLPSR